MTIAKSTEPARPETGEPLPYLGRSVRIVGDWRSVDATQTPHEKNKRGELGKPLHNWYFNRTSLDPLGRIATANTAADRRNAFETVLARAPRGAVNPDRAPVSDPAVLTAHIKRVARYLGASDVGIMRVQPQFLYSGGRYPDDGTAAGASAPPATAETTTARYPYAIALIYAWDYEMGRAHRHRIGDIAYHFGAEHLRTTYSNLASYIREMGYSVATRVATSMPVALAAGLGEMGRHGMLITERFGARVHLGDPILTDMPLVTDEPIDIGVTDFCQVCKKCANTCPTNSITTKGKEVINGVEKFKINWETCYRLRPHVMDYWDICLTCVTVCPYTKPDVWWRTVAIKAIKWTPIPLRGLVTRPLKWIDDVFWGKLGRKRVQFMSYDSGQLKLPDGEVLSSKEQGHYYPLKENSRRFDILKAKLKAKG
ncbi:MAG: 4Fe-4S dicluster domain-containing protein [Chloroflexi bacterium]|nr:4Fe-4S dicluster domain-containing protein [Chloroflexota bacterium]